MKAIAVDQPWGDLILRGIAPVVKLPFESDHRGETLLCAAGSLATWEMAAFYRDPDRFDTNGVIGVVDVLDVVRKHPSPWSYPEDDGFVWVLANPRRTVFQKVPKARIRTKGLFELPEQPLAEAETGRTNERPPIHPTIVADPVCALAVLLSVDSLRDMVEDIADQELPASDDAARRAFVLHMRGHAGEAIGRLDDDELQLVARACGYETKDVDRRELRSDVGRVFGGGVPLDEEDETYYDESEIEEVDDD